MKEGTIREYVGYVVNVSKTDFTIRAQHLDIWQDKKDKSFPIILHFSIERCPDIQEQVLYKIRVNSTMTEITKQEI